MKRVFRPVTAASPRVPGKLPMATDRTTAMGARRTRYDRVHAQGGIYSITVDGVAITQVGQTIQGQFGVMTITGIDLNSGQITYSYTLSDNTSGDNTHDLFTIVVTDKTGDSGHRHADGQHHR